MVRRYRKMQFLFRGEVFWRRVRPVWPIRFGLGRFNGYFWVGRGNDSIMNLEMDQVVNAQNWVLM